MITLHSKNKKLAKKIKKAGDEIYKKLLSEGKDVLYDDREEVSAGEKFGTSDLLGIPLRLVVSEKTIEKNSVEVKKRNAKKFKLDKLSKWL